MDDQTFKTLPDMLKVLQESTIHLQLKEVDQMINFEEVRKMVNEWVDELEKRFK